jgi:cytochrome c peroxidase
MGDMSTGNPGVAYADPNKPDNMGRGSFTGAASDMYKFKVPQLYNIKEAGFYGHGGNFTSVKAVVEYKNAGVSQNSKVPSSQLAAEFVPLHLSAEEVNQLVNFIEKSLRDPRLDRYVPSSLPSGQCFPNNDAQSKLDMGCN